MANEVRVLVTANAGQAVKEIEDVQGKIGKLGSAMGDMLKVAGGIQLSKALDGTVAFGKGSITAASDLNESLSKVRTVLGPASKSVEEFASTSARSFGISKGEALAAAGTYANLFTTMGLGKDVSAEMSVEMVELAADLASFNNIGTDQALDKIRAGLVGEIEPLRALGVSFNAAQVEAKGLEMGLGDANGELSESEKVQARYALILEQTSTAQGDFARTSDGMANQQRILKAQLADVQAQLGQALLPVLVALGQILVNNVMPAVQQFINYAGPAMKAFAQDVKRYWESDLKPALDNLEKAWGKIEPVVKPVIEFVVREVKRMAEVVQNAVGIVVDLIQGDFSGAWDKAKEIVRLFWESIKDRFDTGVRVLQELVPKMVSLGADMMGGLRDGLLEIVDRWIWPFFRNLPGNILGLLGDLGTVLLQAGKDLIQGFIDGIQSMGGAVGDALGKIPGAGAIGGAIGFVAGGGGGGYGSSSQQQVAGGGGGGGTAYNQNLVWDPGANAWVYPWEVGQFGTGPRTPFGGKDLVHDTAVRAWEQGLGPYPTYTGGREAQTIVFNVDTINAASRADAELAAGDLVYALGSRGLAI